MTAFKRIVSVFLKIFVGLFVVAVIALAGLAAYIKLADLEQFQSQIEARLKSNYDITVDLQGEMTLGFANYAPSLKIESLSYGDPVQLTAQNAEMALGNIGEVWDAYKSGEPVAITVTAERMTSDDVVLRNVSMPLLVSKNVKTRAPMEAQLFGADLNASAETQGDRISVNGTLETIEVSQFKEGFEFGIDTEADLRGRLGNRFVETLNGEVIFKSDGGELTGQAIDLWGGDVLINMLPGGKSNTELVCMIAPFTVENGVARTEGIIINTGRVMVLGKGSLDLNTNQLDFVLKPKPKDISLVNLATPVTVKGDLSNPEISLRKMDVAKKIGGILASTINPAAFVFTFSKLGADIENDECYKSAQAQQEERNENASQPDATETQE